MSHFYYDGDWEIADYTDQWPLGRRTSMTYPDGWRLDYAYDSLSRVKTLKNGSRTLASVTHYAHGRTSQIAYGNNTARRYGYDAASRVTSLSIDLAGSAHDQTYGLSYAPSGKLTARASRRMRLTMWRRWRRSPTTTPPMVSISM